VKLCRWVVTRPAKVVLDASRFDDNALFRIRSWRPCSEKRKKTPPDLVQSRPEFHSSSWQHRCLVNGPAWPWAPWTSSSTIGGEAATSSTLARCTKIRSPKPSPFCFGDTECQSRNGQHFRRIMKCDTIAAAILAAFDEGASKVPLVVRLEGTNVEQGKKILGGKAAGR